MKKIIVLICLLSLTFPALSVGAAGINDALEGVKATIKAGDSDEEPSNTKLIQSISLEKFLGNIVSVILGFLGVLLIVLLIIGGTIWMTAGGDASKVDKAKNMIIWAVFGLVVIFASYAIVILLFSGVGIKPEETQTPAGGESGAGQQENNVYERNEGPTPYFENYGNE